MKLHWSPKSPYARKALLVGLEQGLGPFIDRVRTPVPSEQLNTALLAVNPLHKLPTLQLDDGTVLYDSVNIAEYFDSLGTLPSLFLRGTTQYWDVARRHALGDGFIDLLIAWRLEIIRPIAHQNTVFLAASALKADHVLQRLEIDAATLTAMDIGQLATVCALGYLDYRFPAQGWRARHPRLAIWYGRMLERRSVIDTPIDD